MDLGEIIGFTLDELSGPRALLYLLGLILLVLIRIGWELWRSNNQATKLIELSERLHKDMNVLATELRELRTEIRELILDIRRLIERR
ncbi:MAG TPA: hypothetical protein VLG66_06630 [Alphaproteobacteria bacterium]|nr:hypothetical protein [Alphaproteobacteria bacterium]